MFKENELWFTDINKQYICRPITQYIAEKYKSHVVLLEVKVPNYVINNNNNKNINKIANYRVQM